MRSARAFSMLSAAIMSSSPIWERNSKKRKDRKYLLIGQGAVRSKMRDRRQMRYVTAGTDATRTDGANKLRTVKI